MRIYIITYVLICERKRGARYLITSDAEYAYLDNTRIYYIFKFNQRRLHKEKAFFARSALIILFKLLIRHLFFFFYYFKSKHLYAPRARVKKLFCNNVVLMLFTCVSEQFAHTWLHLPWRRYVVGKKRWLRGSVSSVRCHTRNP